MAELSQHVSVLESSYPQRLGRSPNSPENCRWASGRVWVILDGIQILAAAALATLIELNKVLVAGGGGILHDTLFHGRSIGILLVLLCGFTVTLILTSRRLNLYRPKRLGSLLHEQRLSMQACLTSGLLLTGTLYLIRAEDIPRSIVLLTVGLVTVSLNLRRLLYRSKIKREFARGVGLRNVLILGHGSEAQALRSHMESVRSLGYKFQGFITPPGSNSGDGDTLRDVLGTYDNLFQVARTKFVDEILVTAPCSEDFLSSLLSEARIRDINLRLVPETYGGLVLNSSFEYLGQFPTILLHRMNHREVSVLLKRALDILFSSFALLFLSPLLVAIAIAIKVDSQGPILYCHERVGKKGRPFNCFKFRSMVADAEVLRASLMHMNERDGVLFKVTNDPRITRIGKMLRKYSFDELPQFFSVLCGDMSIVGPRPPLPREVREYQPSQLRRLDVTPGITGLWQVNARQDPSFHSYISLDLAYVENWSLWLDLKIIVRTIGVVLAGTGS